MEEDSTPSKVVSEARNRKSIRDRLPQKTCARGTSTPQLHDKALLDPPVVQQSLSTLNNRNGLRMENKSSRKGLRLKTIAPKAPFTNSTSIANYKAQLPKSRGTSKQTVLRQTSSNVVKDILPLEPDRKLNPALRLIHDKKTVTHRTDVSDGVLPARTNVKKSKRASILSEAEMASMYGTTDHTPCSMSDFGSEYVSDSSPSISRRTLASPLALDHVGAWLSQNTAVRELDELFLPEPTMNDFTFNSFIGGDPSYVKRVITSNESPSRILYEVAASPINKPYTLRLPRRQAHSSAKITTLSKASSIRVSSVPSLSRTKNQSALSLRGRRNDPEFRRDTIKTVRWDPAIIKSGPLVPPEAQKWHIEIKEALIEDTTPVNSTKTTEVVSLTDNKENEPPVEDEVFLVATLRNLKKNKRHELEKLMKALREIESDSESEVAALNRPICGENSKTVNIDNVANASKSSCLDAHVPEFISTRALKPKPCTPLRSSVTPSEKEIYTPPRLRIPLAELPTDARKGKALEFDAGTRIIDKVAISNKAINLNVVQTSAPTARPPLPKKKVVLDDDSCHGRQVAAFEQWYADKQLSEFLKKYPLTGRKVVEVEAEKQNLRREMRQNTISHEADVEGDKLEGSETVERKGASSIGSRGVVKEKKFAGGCRRGGIRGSLSLCMGSCGAPIVGVGLPGQNDPAKRHAAAIQQRLEFLLMKEKEKKLFQARMSIWGCR